LNPNFIIKAVHDINGFCGMVFIKNDSLKLYCKPSDVVIDNYKLQSDLTPKLQELCGYLKVPNKLEDNMRVKMKGQEYLTHVFPLQDFKNQTRVKIIFFQDISEAGLYRSYFLIGIFCFMIVQNYRTILFYIIP